MVDSTGRHQERKQVLKVIKMHFTHLSSPLESCRGGGGAKGQEFCIPLWKHENECAQLTGDITEEEAALMICLRLLILHPGSL